MEEVYTYPVHLEKDDNGTILVSFPDFPEAHTFGDTKDDALRRAVDALATIIDAYIKDRQMIPKPSASGEHYVTLPALMATKIALYESMRKQRVNKSELARRLNWHMPQVDRLLNVHHSSRVDQLESAFAVLGKRLMVCVADDQKQQDSGSRNVTGNSSLSRRLVTNKKK